MTLLKKDMQTAVNLHKCPKANSDEKNDIQQIVKKLRKLDSEWHEDVISDHI